MAEGTIEKLTNFQRAISEPEMGEQWRKAQERFHEAMAYFLGYEKLIGACPACAVVESLGCFPLIAEHSPRPPVATVKMNAVDCYPEVVYCGGDQRPSLPCVRIRTELADLETKTEERTRELALLSFDASDLPPMPPNELERIKNKFVPGQRIVRELDFLRQSAPTEDELNRRMLSLRLPAAIVIVACLKILTRIVYYYPDAVDTEWAKALHDELIQGLEGAMDHDCISAARFVYNRPDYGDHFAEQDLDQVLERLILLYLKTQQKQPREINHETILGIVLECREKVQDRLKTIEAELGHILLNKCRIPRPADDPSFGEKGRFVQMLGHYWKLCKRVISYQLDAKSYDPDAIIPLTDSLRLRIGACFAELGSITGAVDAQSELEAFLETCVSLDWRALQAEPQHTRVSVRKIDEFLRFANSAMTKRLYPLTDEERTFIEQSHRDLDRLHAVLDVEQKATSSNATVEKADSRAVRIRPRRSEQYRKDRIIIERKEIDGKDHWYVSGQDKGALYCRSGTISEKVINTLYEEIGRGWIPHKTFMNQCGWPEERYFQSGDNPGNMQRLLSRIRKFLGVDIEFSRKDGVRFPENCVKSN